MRAGLALLALVGLTVLAPHIALAACTSPTGTAGDIVYNADFNTVQFCDDTNWLSMSSTIATETDPKVGTLTATKWCAANAGGTAIDCTQDAPGAGVAGTDKQVQFNDNGTLAGASSFVFDKTTGNVGIGTVAPGTALDVGGAVNVRGVPAPAVSPAGQGRIYFDSTANKFKVSQNGGAYADLVAGSGGTPAGADREIQFNNAGAFGSSSTFKLMSDGDLLLTGTYTGTASVPATGTGTRMFFDTQKAAFRAGSVLGGVWDNISIGNYSVAMGNNTTASGNTSFAMGSNATASGNTSFAIGSGAYAGGNMSVAMVVGLAYGSYSVAMGHLATASGFGSTALGRYAKAGNGTAGSGFGDGSMAIGLIDDAVTITTAPQVTGIQSMGVFMGDQDGLVVSANNQVSFLGGKMVIDPAVPATNLVADTAFETSGTIKIGSGGEACDASREGAIQYLAGSDTFQLCATAGSWVDIATGGGGGGSSSGAAGYIQISDGAGGFTTSGATAGQELLWDSTNKRVGLGIAAPLHRLHVVGPGGTGNYAIYANGGPQGMGLYGKTWGDGTGVYGDNAANGYGVYGSSFTGVGGYFKSTTGPALATGTGNVGIGTTSPAAALDVKPSGTDIFYGRTSAGALKHLIEVDSSGNARQRWYNGAGAVTAYLSTNPGENTYFNVGNLGVGTSTPASTLDVNGTFSVRGSSASYDSLFNYSTNKDIYLRAGLATGKIVIGDQNTGNVELGSVGSIAVVNGKLGVGTATPGEKLTVAGTIESTTGGIKFPDGTTQTTAAPKILSGTFYFATGCTTHTAPCNIDISGAAFASAPVCTLTQKVPDNTGYTENMVIQAITSTTLSIWKGVYQNEGSTMNGHWICVGS